MDDTLQYLLTCYFSFAFIKFMLCLPTLPTFIGTMSRIHGSPKGTINLRYAATMSMFLVLSISCIWVYSMYLEGFGFFSIYTKRQVMRQCLQAQRDADLSDAVPQE